MNIKHLANLVTRANTYDDLQEMIDNFLADHELTIKGYAGFSVYALPVTPTSPELFTSFSYADCVKWCLDKLFAEKGKAE